MPDASERFVKLPPQAEIQPLDEAPAEHGAREPRKGLVGRFLDCVLRTFAEIIRGLMPYLIVGGVLIVAIAVFFGVSTQAAIILLGLGAVGLGVFVAASQG